MEASTATRFGGRQAVVLGASMAGLTAARVLSEHFEKVTLIERDKLEDSIAPRKGVPQGRHLNGLLRRGQDLLSGLFPDLVESLLAGGAQPVEFGKELHWHHFGTWKTQVPSGISATFLSRPFLEAEVRRRVLALPNVRLLDACDVRGLVTDAERRQVTGVLIQKRDGNRAEESLSADLVVDTSGRGSQTPKWLESIGRTRPEESTVKVSVVYTTRLFRRPPSGTVPWKALYILGQSPQSRRLGAVVPIEGDRWLALLGGLLDDHPPTDSEGWMDFARQLPHDALYQGLKDAEPLTDIATTNFPAYLRHHYERLSDFPDGLAVLGDAYCSFNPIYAQGVTMATIGAVALGECLSAQRKRGAAGEISGLSKRFQKTLASLTNVPWLMATSEDFRYPEVIGARPFGLPVLQWYTARLHRSTARDPEVARHFYRAMHMLAGLGPLMRPDVAVRVLKNS